MQLCCSPEAGSGKAKAHLTFQLIFSKVCTNGACNPENAFADYPCHDEAYYMSLSAMRVAKLVAVGFKWKYACSIAGQRERDGAKQKFWELAATSSKVVTMTQRALQSAQAEQPGRIAIG